MCTVSMIGDGWRDTFPKRWPDVDTWPPVPYDPTINPNYISGPTRQEFEALKKEMEELKKLLLAAKEFDEKTGQKDCEMDEKVDLIKRIAKIVGVDMEEVFGKNVR